MMHSSIVNNVTNKLQCSLHLQQFTLYCDRCLELVCQKCTFVGPHNTPIHSLTPINQAYERRFQQINARLSHLSETRNFALIKITQLNAQIQNFMLKIKQEQKQNQNNKIEIEERLKKSCQNSISNLKTQQQLINEKLNRINDLGHQFQTLSQASDIDCLINYQRVMEQMKQVSDQFQILLEKLQTPQVLQLPKQLSKIRIKLKQINTLEQLFKKKTNIIQELIKKLNEEIKKIQTPKIDYQKMLTQINHLLQMFEQKQGQFCLSLDKPNSRKTHFVCHFCGIIMDDHTINTTCLKNQINEQMKSSQNYYISYNNNSKISTNLNGYCKKIPQIGKFGTHRHYFGQANNIYLFYRASYLRIMLGNQVLSFLIGFLSEQDQYLRTINQTTKVQNNSFFNYLQLLFLKVWTLGKIKNKNIEKLFNNEDLKNDGKQTGYCESIAMEYILMQILGLKQRQTSIILEICWLPCAQLAQSNEKRKQTMRNYKTFITKLKQVKI